MRTRSVGRTFSRVYRTALIALALLCYTYSHSVYAYVGFWEEFADFDQNWIGMGELTLNSSGCIVSSTANNEWTVLFGGGQARDYRLRVSPPLSTFELYSGEFSLPFSLEVTDLHANPSQLHPPLQPGQYSPLLTYEHYCSSLGHNAELTMRFSAAVLYSAPAGTYTASLELTAEREGGGGGSGIATAELDARVVIPELIQVSKINDISFGAYDGVATELSRTEAFCIYSNTTDYTLTPSSSTVGGSPNSFAMAGGSGNVIEYSVEFANDAGAAGGDPMANGVTSGAYPVDLSSLSLDCNGGENAAIHLRISGSELQSKPPGTYSETLLLQVAPI